jgi:glucosamine 6-phosphate synthetase-like amidotransferase/phosphosugar isomerase protein
MCGLTGVVLSDNVGGPERDRIRDLFTRNLLANEERGREATGAALLKRDGTVRVEKAPLTATEFVKTREYERFLSKLDGQTTIMLGHTRRPTKGEARNAGNNHPIVAGDVVGVHNGTITNDDEIFTQRRNIGMRCADVDSEAIFALIDSIGPASCPEGYVRGIKEAASWLLGSYTTLLFNRSMPDHLFLLKYDNPISAHYSEPLGSLFFSSRYVFLRKAFGRSVITEALPSKMGFVFDRRQLPRLGKEPVMQFPLRQQARASCTQTQDTGT